jgi:hypothetical protein
VAELKGCHPSRDDKGKFHRSAAVMRERKSQPTLVQTSVRFRPGETGREVSPGLCPAVDPSMTPGGREASSRVFSRAACGLQVCHSNHCVPVSIPELPCGSRFQVGRNVREMTVERHCSLTRRVRTGLALTTFTTISRSRAGHDRGALPQASKPAGLRAAASALGKPKYARFVLI